MKVTPVP